jgi:hypothetical protein
MLLNFNPEKVFERGSSFLGAAASFFASAGKDENRKMAKRKGVKRFILIPPFLKNGQV